MSSRTPATGQARRSRQARFAADGKLGARTRRAAARVAVNGFQSAITMRTALGARRDASQRNNATEAQPTRLTGVPLVSRERADLRGDRRKVSAGWPHGAPSVRRRLSREELKKRRIAVVDRSVAPRLGRSSRDGTPTAASVARNARGGQARRSSEARLEGDRRGHRRRETTSPASAIVMASCLQQALDACGAAPPARGGARSCRRALPARVAD